MTQCFKDHECDNQILNQNTKPFSECETRMVYAYDAWIEVTEVPVLTCEGIWRVSSAKPKRSSPPVAC